MDLQFPKILKKQKNKQPEGLETIETLFYGLKERIKEENENLKTNLRLLSREKLTLNPYSPEMGPIVTFEVMEGYVEKERYWVSSPHTFVSILFNEREKEYLYFVVEPELSVFDRMLLETVYENILDTLTLYETSEQEKSEVLEKKTLELIDSYSIEVEMLTIYKILYYIMRDYIRYDRIDVLMRDPNIEDISCNGTEIPIFLYHRKYHNIKTNISFEADKLNSFVTKLAQRCEKHISIGEPLINGTLPDGSRLNASLGKEVTFRGSSFTIRKFREHAFTPADLIRNGTYSSEIMAYLWFAVENGYNIMIVGATAAGKTSTLNAISMFIPPMAKIISIEDTHELVLHHSNWLGTIARQFPTNVENVQEIDMYELLRQALRQRPEYIIVGEIRGKEAMTLFQAMNTGHITFSTMHADTVNTVISRLESDPINIPRVMIQELNILLIQKMVKIDGEIVRRMDTMIEFTGIDVHTQDLRFNEVYKFDPRTNTFNTRGRMFFIDSIMAKHNWNEKKLMSEFENRKKILEHMVKMEMDEYDISLLIQSYYFNPEKTMKDIKEEKTISSKNYETTPKKQESAPTISTELANNISISKSYSINEKGRGMETRYDNNELIEELEKNRIYIKKLKDNLKKIKNI